MQMFTNRKPLIRLACKIPGMLDEIYRVQRQEIDEAKRLANQLVYADRSMQDHNRDMRTLIPLIIMVFIKVAWTLYEDLRPEGTPKNHTVNRYSTAAVGLTFFFTVIKSLFNSRRNRLTHQSTALERRLLALIATRDPEISNEKIIVALEKIKSQVIIRPNEFICLISSSIMTRPCHIEKLIGDLWVPLDGIIDSEALSEWFVRNGNRVPQTNEVYNPQRYRIVYDHQIERRILEFLTQLICKHLPPDNTSAERSAPTM